jgi:catechol 2,3-dioxygenase-like lactoylglutathione lyase family enzyme
MDWKLEVVPIPVSDVDRAKAFYTEKIGFNADHDHTLSEEIRFVQLTPPGSACSIALGKGLVKTPGAASRSARSLSTRRPASDMLQTQQCREDPTPPPQIAPQAVSSSRRGKDTHP